MDLFTNAKSLPVEKKASKKLEVKIPGLAKVAQIDAAIKALSALKELHESSVKETCFSSFASHSARPENFRGIDENASASVELRKRSSASALSEDEVKYLTEKNIPTEKKISAPSLFCVNPKYAGDLELLGKVSAALSSIVPEDFFLIQQEKSSTIVTDKSIETAFAIGDHEAIRMTTLIALKPKIEGDLSVSQILANLSVDIA